MGLYYKIICKSLVVFMRIYKWFFRYAKVIAGETEKYWGGIMHQHIHPKEHIEGQFVTFNNSQEWENIYALDSE